MGIYNLEHFDSKDEALKYYASGVKHFANKAYDCFEKGLDDPIQKEELKLSMSRVATFLEYFNNTMNHQF